jgi:aminopeptidase N
LKASIEGGVIPGIMRLLVLLLANGIGSGVALAVAPAPQHDIQVSLAADSGELRVTDRVLVTRRDRYRFQLSPWLEVDEVRLNGAPVDLRSGADGYVVELANSGQHELEFSLSGKLPLRAPGEPPNDMASSHGEDGTYLPGYAAWIPHDPAQPLDFRLRVSVPAGLRAVATGRLIAESVDAGSYRASFEQEQPGEAPSLFIGPYQVHERLSNGLRLRTYFHAGLEAFAEAYLDSASRYIERYQAEIGEYPYSDFYIVSAPLPVGLGFPGLTYVDRRIVPLPFMRSRSLAHEVLHNWWGNGVGVDYAAGNWAEGLTTYMADYALEADNGEDAARAMRVRWLRDYAALPAARDLPVGEFRSKQHQAAQVIGYNKLAFIFHMLELEIGPQAFAEAIRRFWREQRFASASWAQLQAAFEQAAGRDLGWFFSQWLEYAGAPRLSLGAHSVTRVDEGYLTRIEVLQPVAGYRLRLPVLLDTDGGSERRDITVSAALTIVEWITPERPRSIHFDPDSDVFRRLQQDETPPIMRDVTLNSQTLTLVAGEEPGFIETARLLATRLLDTPPNYLEAGRSRAAQQPLLLIAPFAQLPAQLARLGIELPAELPAIDYQGAAWTARLANNTPVLVVAAESAQVLQSMLRALPHYGGQSYVLFGGARALDRGLWPLSRGSLFRDLREID